MNKRRDSVQETKTDPRPLTPDPWRLLCMVLAALLFAVPPALAQDEMKRLTARLLAPPTIKAETGFTAKLLVPPGRLYDPLWMLPRGASVWLNDDGGEEEGKGSRLLVLDHKGKISVLAGLGKLLPVTGFD